MIIFGISGILIPFSKGKHGDQDLRGWDHRWTPYSTGTPPPPPDFQVLPAAQSGRDTSGDGEPGRAELGATRQALAGSRRIREVSEGSMTPTGQASPAPSGAGGAAREGDITSAHDQAGGGGLGRLG